MEEDKKTAQCCQLPSNFVTLRQLQERWLKEQERKQKEKEQQEQEKELQEKLKQIQREQPKLDDQRSFDRRNRQEPFSMRATNKQNARGRKWKKKNTTETAVRPETLEVKEDELRRFESRLTPVERGKEKKKYMTETTAEKEDESRRYESRAVTVRRENEKNKNTTETVAVKEDKSRRFELRATTVEREMEKKKNTTVTAVVKENGWWRRELPETPVEREKEKREINEEAREIRAKEVDHGNGRAEQAPGIERGEKNIPAWKLRKDRNNRKQRKVFARKSEDKMKESKQGVEIEEDEIESVVKQSNQTTETEQKNDNVVEDSKRTVVIDNAVEVNNSTTGFDKRIDNAVEENNGKVEIARSVDCLVEEGNQVVDIGTKLEKTTKKSDEMVEDASNFDGVLEEGDQTVEIEGQFEGLSIEKKNKRFDWGNTINVNRDKGRRYGYNGDYSYREHRSHNRSFYRGGNGFYREGYGRSNDNRVRKEKDSGAIWVRKEEASHGRRIELIEDA